MSASELGQTVVMVTHDAAAASYAERVVFLRDGQLAGEMTTPTTEGILETLKTLEK
ncbi:ABC-type lipoprotein export system ATPase subunit [Haloactinomyces albus]|uniref:ABC-type lipoprotein export system ATPase subunit n=1 Tax=Haloactinomyces albus TaxID=1352928 RepID=A0AAE4CR04_9ACTN|nr:ABC-type lipoprotein export system ATPase subunit [Haloactinomyces albus]